MRRKKNNKPAEYAGACLLLACMAWAGLSFLPRVQAADAVTPPEINGDGITEHLNSPLPLNLAFKDEQGRDVRLGDYFNRGHAVIVTLVYFRCPSICGLELNALMDGMRHMPGLNVGKDYDIVTVSFDPKEGPELAAAKKEAYLKAMGNPPGAAEGWHFLTGEQASIAQLTESIGFKYRWLEPTRLDGGLVTGGGQFSHPTGIFVITPQGKISRYIYNWSQFSQNADVLRLSLIEASNGNIGSPLDQVILWCFHYDPAQGKYVAMAYRIMSLGGLVTVLFVGGILGSLWYFEIRHRKTAKIAGANP